MDAKQYAAVIAAVTILLFATVFILVMPRGGVGVIFSDENLSGGSPRFAPGEEYVYEMRLPEGTFNATVRVDSLDAAGGAQCVRAVRSTPDVVGAPPMAACYFSDNGSLAYFAMQRNGTWERLPEGTYDSEPVMVFFEPWMLALREGWSGAYNATWSMPSGIVQVAKIERRSASSYRFLRAENYSGRLALVAEVVTRDIEMSGGREMTVMETRRTVWVDDEKWVVLREEY